MTLIFDCCELQDFAKDMYNNVNPEEEFIPVAFSQKNVLIDGQLVDILIHMLRNKDGTYYFYAAIIKANSEKKLPTKEFLFCPTKEFLFCQTVPTVDDYLKAFIAFNQRISQLFYCKCRDKLCYLW